MATDRFIATFCHPNNDGSFTNALGGFTPCFTELFALGLAHLCGCILSWLRIATLRDPNTAKQPLSFWCTWAHRLSLFAGVLCTMIPIMQLNGRLGGLQTSYISSEEMPPVEVLSYAVGSLCWLSFSVAVLHELTRGMARQRSWMLRFVCAFALGGHCAKLNFVMRLAHDTNYFYYLYLVQFSLHAFLGFLAVFYHPSVPPPPKSSDVEMLPLQPGSSSDSTDRNIAPEFRCSLWAQLTYGWVTPLLDTGFKKPLDFEDVWALETMDQNQHIHSKFVRIFSQKKKLVPTIVIHWGYDLFITFLWKVFNDASQFVGPVFLKLLLESITKHEPWSKGYFYAFLIFAGQILGMLGENFHFQRVMRVGFQIRSALTSEIFLRGLRISHEQRSQFPVGKINNLVTSDCEAMQALCTRVMNLWSAPLRIIVCMFLLYDELGLSALVALAILLLMIPVQSKVVSYSKDATRKTLSLTDERTKSTREVINSMDIVKMYAWEDSFKDRISTVRTQELTWIKKSNLLMAYNSFIVAVVPVLVSVLTLVVFAVLGNELTPTVAFTSLTLFAILRNPLFVLPDLIVALANTAVSVNRLEKYLLSEDEGAKRQQVHKVTDAKADSEGIAIRIDPKSSFSWDSDSGNATLRNVGLSVKQGSLVAVVGQTGSGKSSLLAAILGEIPSNTTEPSVTVHGKVAFVPQQAWIFNATIQQNICFQSEFDAERFHHAVSAARMEADIASQPANELTEIGEKGVNLSGGQRQRISVARAVYAGADIFLLDDPLSALDARVGRELFDDCICSGAMSSATRVLATNQVHLLSRCEHVVFLHQGEIVAQGTYEDLKQNNAQFKQFLGQIVEENTELASEQATSANDQPSESTDAPKQQQTPPTKSTEATVEKGKLVSAEHRESGIVDQRVLLHYAKAMGGNRRLTLLLGSYVVTEALRLLGSWWMSLWTDSMEPGKKSSHSTTYYILGFTLFSIAQIASMLFTQIAIALFSYRAATVLHDQMLSKILRVSMSFFHANPLGRVLNRFSKDQADIDRSLASFVSMFLRSASQLISTLVLISVITPFTSTVFIPLFAAFFWIFMFFQRSAREVKRLDALTRSPVYAFFNQSLVGSATVRAFGAEQYMMQALATKIDDNIALNLVSMSMNRWLSVRLELLGALMILASAIFAVVEQGSASDTGLSLSYALGITGLMTATIRLGSLAENSFNSVERVLEYTTLESEAPPTIPGNRPPPGWPDKGAIKFDDAWMKYRPDLPPVLKGLSVALSAGSKVGICGRTGAGKSSIFNTLFRIVELSSGSISIDDKDISKFGVQDVRRALAIIPQEPVLFAGSVRENLDPFHESTDDDVWEALEQAHLKELVEQLPGRLSAKVMESGENFSVGQRQLMCLARALLRKSRIIVLDEATASVDVQTDALIQTTIREAFASCTMLIIAHRLNTIIDCDNILVLDAGQAIEFGTPAQLLSAKGVFSSLVDETGVAMSRLLRNIAEGKVDKSQLLRSTSRDALRRVTRLTKEQVALARVYAAHETLRLALSGQDVELTDELQRNKTDMRHFYMEMFGLVRELMTIASANMESVGLDTLDESTLVLIQHIR